jgi:hypothetical protein
MITVHRLKAILGKAHNTGAKVQVKAGERTFEIDKVNQVIQRPDKTFILDVELTKVNTEAIPEKEAPVETSIPEKEEGKREKQGILSKLGFGNVKQQKEEEDGDEG